MLRKLVLILALVVGAYGVEEERNLDIIKMDLSYIPNLQNIDFIAFFPNLKELNLSGSPIGNNYKAISKLPNLEILKINYIQLTTTKYLKPLVSLKSLSIAGFPIRKAIRHIAQLSNLEELNILGNPKGIEKMSQLTNLKHLSLSGVFNREDDEEFEMPTLDFLSSLKSLKSLDLSNNDYIFYIAPLIELKKLKKLNLSGNKSIRDLNCLRKMESLTEVDLSCLSSAYIPTLVDDLKVLNKLPNLKQVKVDKNMCLPKFKHEITVIFS